MGKKLSRKHMIKKTAHKNAICYIAHHGVLALVNNPMVHFPRFKYFLYKHEMCVMCNV